MAATDSEPDSAAQAAGLSQDERAELERLRVEAAELRRKQADQPLVTDLEGCRFVPLIGSQGYRSGW